MYGQYSKYATKEKTKAELLERAPAETVWSRKAGKNRLHYKLADGRECYVLHETVIAELSADRKQLTLNDGGWASPTTRRAMAEAASAFKLGQIGLSGGMPRAANCLIVWDAPPNYETRKSFYFDRSIVLDAETFEPVNASPGIPMVRAYEKSNSHGQPIVVEYRDGRVVSSGGFDARVPPGRLLYVFERVFHMLLEHKRGERNNGFDMLGLYFSPGRFGRTVHIGCHVFEAADLRAVFRRIAAMHVLAAKDARKRFLNWRRDQHK